MMVVIKEREGCARAGRTKKVIKCEDWAGGGGRGDAVNG